MSSDDLGERLARIETQLEVLINRFDPELSGLKDRVMKLERWVWVAVGIALASGGTALTQLIP